MTNYRALVQVNDPRFDQSFTIAVGVNAPDVETASELAMTSEVLHSYHLSDYEEVDKVVSIEPVERHDFVVEFHPGFQDDEVDRAADQLGITVPDGFADAEDWLRMLRVGSEDDKDVARRLASAAAVLWFDNFVDGRNGAFEASDVTAKVLTLSGFNNQVNVQFTFTSDSDAGVIDREFTENGASRA